MASELKFCGRCNRQKSLRSFANDKSRSDGKYPWCRACRGKYIRETSAKDRVSDDTSRVCDTCGAGIGGSHPNVKYCSGKCKSKSMLARSYGLDIQEYQALISSMGGKCPICGKTVRKWCIDHDHETGETFGPVCSPCNSRLIAFSGRDPETADRLGEFLRNPPARLMFGPRYVRKKIANQRSYAVARRLTGIDEAYQGSTRDRKPVKRRKKVRGS